MHKSSSNPTLQVEYLLTASDRYKLNYNISDLELVPLISHADFWNDLFVR